MSTDGSVMAAWGGEERKFRLRIGELRELQQLVNERRGANPIGPWTLLKLIAANDAWPDDLREIIRLGLIGGGATRMELIGGLVKRYVDERPLLESAPVAYVILGTALVGDKSDEVGKKNTSDEPTMAATLSDFLRSMDQARQSDSPRDKSTNAAFGNSRPVSRDTIEPTAQPTGLTQ